MRRLRTLVFALASGVLIVVLIGVVNSNWSRSESTVIIGIAILSYLSVTLAAAKQKK